MSALEKIYRLPKVLEFTGKKKSALYADIAAGKFSKPIPLSPDGRAVGWLESELLAWQARQISQRERARDLAPRRRPEVRRRQEAA
jgi:prophage regulatory protein